MSDTSGRSLLLVRHGRTVDNARGLLLGRADPELDELGRRQAEAVGVAIASGRFGPVAAVVSSPLRRAMGTAEAIGAPVLLDDRLLELDYGELESLTRLESQWTQQAPPPAPAPQAYPAAPQPAWGAPQHGGHHGGHGGHYRQKSFGRMLFSS